MNKIRINELARQLEIPSHSILEMLPELGVTEKKTHSSSIDEPVAEIIRSRVQGLPESSSTERSGSSAVAVAEPPHIEEQPLVHTAVQPPIAAKGAPPASIETPSAPSDNGTAAPTVEEARSKPAPIRPPLATGPSAPLHPPLRTGGAVPARPSPPTPRPGQILTGPRQPMPATTPQAPPSMPVSPVARTAASPPATE